MNRTRRRLILYTSLVLLFGGPIFVVVSGQVYWQGKWYEASRQSAGILPDPSTYPNPEIIIFAARLFGVRGAFAVHSWIAAKRAGNSRWNSYEVIGWREGSGLPVVAVNTRPADGLWYGNRPTILKRITGPGVEVLIDQIEEAVARYPYPDDYTLWPGPNSNTFIAHIGREVPGLGMELPATAIGKDFLLNGSIVAPSISGTGYQVSVYGLAGVTLAKEEGLEINLLGANFGLDPMDVAFKAPGVGRVGLFD